jgi:hypothetical protein
MPFNKDGYSTDLTAEATATTTANGNNSRAEQAPSLQRPRPTTKATTASPSMLGASKEKTNTTTANKRGPDVTV